MIGKAARHSSFNNIHKSVARISFKTQKNDLHGQAMKSCKTPVNRQRATPVEIVSMEWPTFFDGLAGS